MNLLVFLKDLGIPFLGFILFFVFQSMGFMKEKVLTLFIILVTVGIFLLAYHKNEWALFLVGILFGIIIEIGLRYFGYQQVWKDASFFGVPYWLPLVWGVGFVIITRLGMFTRSF